MNWLQTCDKEAKKLTPAKRQEFVDYMYKDHMKLGEAAAKAGISFDAANGVMSAQIVKHTHLTFNPIAK